MCLVYLSLLCYVPHLTLISIGRVGEGTVPLAIVVHIDGSFVKHKIPVKPIYVTFSNLNSAVSGKACALQMLGMMPSIRKSTTLLQTETWRKDCRLRLYVSDTFFSRDLPLFSRDFTYVHWNILTCFLIRIFIFGWRYVPILKTFLRLF